VKAERLVLIRVKEERLFLVLAWDEHLLLTSSRKSALLATFIVGAVLVEGEWLFLTDRW
jgi:hypothetical protein